MITLQKAFKLRELIVKASASLDDGDALDGMELYDYWEPDKDYKKDTRLRYKEDSDSDDVRLYRVLKDHRSSAVYPPSIYTASLYTEVPRPGQGDTPSNPIPYNNNMKLEKDKYYSQNGVVYICTRDTINPVYADLSALVGHYVEVYGG